MRLLPFTTGLFTIAMLHRIVGDAIDYRSIVVLGRPAA